MAKTSKPSLILNIGPGHNIIHDARCHFMTCHEPAPPPIHRYPGHSVGQLDNIRRREWPDYPQPRFCKACLAKYGHSDLCNRH